MAKQKEKEILPANAFDEIDLGWIAPEYLRYERGWPWFALLFLINPKRLFRNYYCFFRIKIF